MLRRQALQFQPDPSLNPTAQVYDLTTRVVLDREDENNPLPGQTLIYLICMDGAGVQSYFNQTQDNTIQSTRLSSTMTATLTIGDVNDHTPIFEQFVYHTAMRENNYIGEKVVQV